MLVWNHANVAGVIYKYVACAPTFNISDGIWRPIWLRARCTLELAVGYLAITIVLSQDLAPLEVQYQLSLTVYFVLMFTKNDAS
jgi:hypothetical protein